MSFHRCPNPPITYQSSIQSFHHPQSLPPLNPTILSDVNPNHPSESHSSYTPSSTFICPPPGYYSNQICRLKLTEISTVSNTIYHSHIQNLLIEYSNHTLRLTDGYKMNNKTLYDYWISNTVTFHRIHNAASVFTAKLIAIFSCLYHLTELPSMASTSSWRTLLIHSMRSQTPPPQQTCSSNASSFSTPSFQSTDSDSGTYKPTGARFSSQESYGISLPAYNYQNYFRSLVLQ